MVQPHRGAVDEGPEDTTGEELTTWLATLSPRTAPVYRVAVTEWSTFCRREGQDPRAAGVRVLERFEASLRAGGRLSVATVRAKVSAVRSFRRYLRGLDPTLPTLAARPALVPRLLDEDDVPLEAPSSALVDENPPAQHSTAVELVDQDHAGARQLAAVPDPYAAAAAGVLDVLAGADVDEALDDLVARWLLAYSPRSAAAHRANLQRWLDHCRQLGQDPLTVQADVVLAYQEQLNASDLAPVAARAKMADVRSFYRFVVEERARIDDPAAATTRRAPASIAATLSVHGQRRSTAQLAAGFLLSFSGHTRRAYETGLRLWFTWCLEVGLEPQEADRPHLDAFRSLLNDRYAPGTVNQRLVIVRAFYRYLLEEGAITVNPARSVRLNSLPNISTSTGLDADEVRQLLRAARNHGPGHHALLTLLALNGLRISEALSADVEHLTTLRGHQVLMVERKGYQGTRQPVPLAPWTVQVLQEWLDVRADRLAAGVGDQESGPLFVNERGTRLGRHSVWATMRLLAKRAVPQKASTLHPHDLRNAFITLSLDAGAALRDVQDSAGHASADTTRRYDTGRNSLNRNATYTLSSYLARRD